MVTQGEEVLGWGRGKAIDPPEPGGVFLGCLGSTQDLTGWGVVAYRTNLLSTVMELGVTSRAMETHVGPEELEGRRI